MKLTSILPKTRNKLLLITAFLAILFFSLFTFYGISWGAPYFFHPDERNIAASVSQLDFTNNMNPNFFAYGSLPIYCTYFLGVALNYITTGELNPSVFFEDAVVIGRVVSAILSILLVLLTYITARKVNGETTGIIALVLSCFSVGYLQFSHFGTFEIWLSFFSLAMIYLLITFIKTKKNAYLILSAAAFGIILSLKVSSIVLAPISLAIIILSLKPLKFSLHKIFKFLKLLFYFLYSSFITYIISSPFNLLDSESFLSSMRYEGGVATGSLPVFYTGSFMDTVPILYQYQEVLPFVINPILTILSIPAIIYAIYLVIKKKEVYFLLIISAFMLVFLSSSLLFVKWTRYLIPSLPFLYIIFSISFSESRRHMNKIGSSLILLVIFTTSFIFAFSFVKTVRLTEDSRVEAMKFANKNINPDARIASEVYDLGIVPFNPHFQEIKLYNFYDLDNSPGSVDIGEVVRSDYIILPSQRIYESRMSNKDRFPEGYNFYGSLFSGESGFRKIYQTPCDIFCKLAYKGDPVFNLEGTASVFDRPTVFIFKR